MHTSVLNICFKVSISSFSAIFRRFLFHCFLFPLFFGNFFLFHSFNTLLFRMFSTYVCAEFVRDSHVCAHTHRQSGENLQIWLLVERLIVIFYYKLLLQWIQDLKTVVLWFVCVCVWSSHCEPSWTDDIWSDEIEQKKTRKKIAMKSTK